MHIHIHLYILQSISWKNIKKGHSDFQGRERCTQRIRVGDFSLSIHLDFLTFEKYKCIISIQSYKRIFKCLFMLIPFSLHCLENSNSGFLPCGVQPLHADFEILMSFLEIIHPDIVRAFRKPVSFNPLILLTRILSKETTGDEIKDRCTQM